MMNDVVPRSMARQEEQRQIKKKIVGSKWDQGRNEKERVYIFFSDAMDNSLDAEEESFFGTVFAHMNKTFVLFFFFFWGYLVDAAARRLNRSARFSSNYFPLYFRFFLPFLHRVRKEEVTMNLCGEERCR